MTQPASKGVSVSVRDLRRSLGGRLVLKGIGFEVAAGEIFVIMGPSGSGKTVLLRHLIGLEQPDAGDILIDGHPLSAANSLAPWRAAMVFQSSGLLNSLTVAENVGLYLTEHRLASRTEVHRIVHDKLALVGLEGWGDQMPSELSGGMRKRVAIARALVIEPQLILYDEPTSELDPIVATVIAGEICSLRRRIGVTSVVVTHDRDLAFGIADRIAFLEQGEICALGTPDEVRNSDHPLVRQFLSADFQPRSTSHLS